jgi:hypothetical protein
MARTITQIKDSIIADMQAYPELTSLLANTSTRSIWYLFVFTISGAISLLEQIMDSFKTDTDANIAKSAAGTPLWLQDKAFKFQYSSSTPQIVKLDTTTFAPTYDIINPDLQIVKRCSVNSTVANYVTLKTAKDINGTLTALTTPENDSFQGYINTIGTAGINYIATSSPANQMYWTAQITYDAQYASTIKQSLSDAATTFLATIPFDGIFRVNKFEAYILNNVPGVVDLITNELSIREDFQTVAQGTILVTGNDVMVSNLNPSAGYIIPETTSGFGILDGNNILLIAY